LDTDSDSLAAAFWHLSIDYLQIGQKSASGDACNFGTNPTEVFCFTASFNHIANLRSLAANFAFFCHDFATFARHFQKLGGESIATSRTVATAKPQEILSILLRQAYIAAFVIVRENKRAELKSASIKP
jgi:hypothetical protein